jgi:hypothetical protein
MRLLHLPSSLLIFSLMIDFCWLCQDIFHLFIHTLITFAAIV